MKTNKKNLVISVLFIIITIFTVHSFIKYMQTRNKNIREEYLDDCIQILSKFDFLDDKNKHRACNCRHDYLYERYEERIYQDSFIIPTRKDSLALIDCLLMNLDTMLNIDNQTFLELLNSNPLKENE